MRGSIQLDRCPASQTSTLGREVVRMAAAVSAGFLPASGGYGNQPSRIMRLVEIALHEKGEIENARATQAQAVSSTTTKTTKGGRRGAR